MTGGFFIPNIRKGRYIKFISAKMLGEIVIILLLFYWFLTSMGVSVTKHPMYMLYPLLVVLLTIIPFKGQRLIMLLINLAISPFTNKLMFPVEGDVKYDQVIKLNNLQIGINAPKFTIKDKQYIELVNKAVIDVYDNDGYLIESQEVNAILKDFDIKNKKANYYIENVNNITLKLTIPGHYTKVYNKDDKKEQVND